MSQDIENKLEFKDKLFLFYRKNKFKIISLIILIFVVFLTLILINENQKKKNVLQAENYIKAGIYLSNGKEKQALEIFEEIIKSKNKFYSILALNSILEKNLVEEKEKILNYFETLETINFSEDTIDVIYFKKALFYLKNSNSQQGNNLLQKLIDKNSNQKSLAQEIID
tara:strand:+ start:3371 stop:3877 length:507 start_codon:yes stop_codon:yes gene_type:complete